MHSRTVCAAKPHPLLARPSLLCRRYHILESKEATRLSAADGLVVYRPVEVQAKLIGTILVDVRRASRMIHAARKRDIDIRVPKQADGANSRAHDRTASARTAFWITQLGQLLYIPCTYVLRLACRVVALSPLRWLSILVRRKHDSGASAPPGFECTLTDFWEIFTSYYPVKEAELVVATADGQTVAVKKQFARDAPSLLRINGERPAGDTAEQQVREVRSTAHSRSSALKRDAADAARLRALHETQRQWRGRSMANGRPS
jgi:hypothetical protein